MQSQQFLLFFALCLLLYVQAVPLNSIKHDLEPLNTREKRAFGLRGFGRGVFNRGRGAGRGLFNRGRGAGRRAFNRGRGGARRAFNRGRGFARRRG